VISAPLHFGQCPCGGKYDSKVVEIRMTTTHPPTILSNVFQGACPRCGSRVYKAATLERVEAVFKDEPVDRRLNRAEIWQEAECWSPSFTRCSVPGSLA
jgi:hypothetical protein